MKRPVYDHIGGYKYRLREPFRLILPELVGHQAEGDHGWVHLGPGGVLAFSEGYCWDGASGPTVDDDSNMRASLVHDGLYQLIRQGKLPRLRSARQVADKVFRRLLKEDGMPGFRRWYYWTAVRAFGGLWSAAGGR